MCQPIFQYHRIGSSSRYLGTMRSYTCKGTYCEESMKTSTTKNRRIITCFQFDPLYRMIHINPTSLQDSLKIVGDTVISLMTKRDECQNVCVNNITDCEDLKYTKISHLREPITGIIKHDDALFIPSNTFSVFKLSADTGTI